MSKGRIYRRCACRGHDGRQIGARCPLLVSDRKHGVWAFAVDVPTADGRRKTMRRSPFPTKAAAQRAKDDVLARYGAGVKVDDTQLTADYLRRWLDDKRHTLRPKTLHSYSEYVIKDLVPTLGAIRLEHLRHDHVASLVAQLQADGRGVPTIRRIVGVLSSALSDAVKQRRLAHNVARHVPLPPERRAERTPWTAAQAVLFLDHTHQVGDRLADLFEVIIGTGLRRGEALAVRWPDIDLDARVLHVHPERGNLSDVAGHLMFTAPKTKGSAAGVGLAARVVAALQRQRRRQDAERGKWGEAYGDLDLVFARENGAPLRPEYVLARFVALTEQAGLPRVRLHDLRHLAATLMLASGVPLALVSKVMRHSKVGITVDTYGHLTTEASLAAADSLGSVLDAAAAELANEQAMRAATTLRPQPHDQDLLDWCVDSLTAGEDLLVGAAPGGAPSGPVSAGGNPPTAPT